MPFTYDSTRADAISRLRFALGDTVDPGILQDADYQASLDLHGNDEEAALRDLAAGLAARFANEPDRVTLPSGLSVAWSQRVGQWNTIAAGSTPARQGRPRQGRLKAGSDYRPT